MASRIDHAPPLLSGAAASAAVSAPVLPITPDLRARAAKRALELHLPFILTQANKARTTLAPLDVLRFSRSALPLGRDLRALVTGKGALQKALNTPLQLLEKLGDPLPQQLPALELHFATLCEALKVAALPAKVAAEGAGALRLQFQKMIDALMECRGPMGEDAAWGARALISCCDKQAGRPGMTVGVGTLLAEEARTLTSALSRPARKDGEDELGICFDARTSFTRIHGVLVALKEQC